MQLILKPLFSILLVFIWFSCSKKIHTAQKPLLVIEYSEAPLQLDNSTWKFSSDIKYDDHARNSFDIILPNKTSTTPLVIFIHGGGFTGGDKRQAYERYQAQINDFLGRGIAFASINYRFLDDTHDGVITSLLDSKRCLQFIRYHAASFNIDPDKVAIFGSSAGAGTSLWIGLNDQMAEPNHADPILRESTRVPAIGAIATQATYDILRWDEVFESYSVSIARIPDPLLQRLNPFYGLEQFDRVHDPDIVAYREKVDMLKLMDENDPPIWVKNEQDDVPPMFDLQHHPAHAQLLKKYADSIGIQSRFYIPGFDIEDESGEGLIDFFERAFTNLNSK